VVPIALVVIYVLLYLRARSSTRAVLLAVPFALAVAGLPALTRSCYNFGAVVYRPLRARAVQTAS